MGARLECTIATGGAGWMSVHNQSSRSERQFERSEQSCAAAVPTGGPRLIDASTDDVEPPWRVDYWQDILSNRFGVPELRCHDRDRREFSGRVVGLEVGAIKVSRVTARRAEVARTTAATAARRAEDYHLEIPLRGVAVLAQGGRETLLRPGDFALYDNSAPFRYGFRSSFDELVIQVPRAILLAKEPRLGQVTAVAVRGDAGLGVLVSQLLRHAADLDLWSGSPVAAAFLANLVDLMVNAFSERLGLPDRPLARSRYLSDARAYALAHLEDPSLSLQQIASAVGISLRYLHALFRSEGTTASRWILERRLERARLLLADAQQARSSITEVAAAVGFVDLSHFSRLFKTSFGLSPRAYRRDRLGPNLDVPCPARHPEGATEGSR